MRANEIPISTTCVVTRKNVKNLVKYIYWCYQNRLSMIGFNYLRMNSLKDAELHLVPDINEYIESTKRVIDTLIELNQKGDSTYKLYVLEISNIANKIINQYFDCYVCSAPCQAGKRIVCLNTDGRLDCCDCVGKNKDNTIGYYKKGELANLLEIARQKKFSVDKENIAECQGCEVAKYCTYGCVAENIIFYGNKNIQKPGKMCFWYREIISYLLEKFEDGISPDLFVESYI